MNMNVKKMLNSKNSENMIICLLVLVLVGLVVYYVYQNNREGFNNEKPTLMLFYADWCPHCTKAKPLFEELQQTNNDVNVKLVNCEEEKELAKQFNVRAYPTVYIVNGENKVELQSAVTPSNINEFIANNL